MPRRPWFLRANIFAALERLRSFIWSDRIKAFFTRRPKSREDDKKLRKATPEVRPLDYRNPPSESICTTALPLAATAAAVAAVALLADSQAAASEARFGSVSDGAGKDFDTSFNALGGGGGSGGGGEGEGASPKIASDWLYSDSFSPISATSTATAPESNQLINGVDELGNSTSLALNGAEPRHSGFHVPSGGSSAPSSVADNIGSAANNISTRSGSASASTTSDPNLINNTPTNSSSTASVPAAKTHKSTQPTNGNRHRVSPPTTTPRTFSAQADFNSAQVTPLQLKDLAAANSTHFVSNAGQWAPSVDFAVQGDGYQLLLENNSAVLELARTDDSQISGANPTGLTTDVVTLTWTGMNANAQPTGSQQLSSVSNFYVGNDPSKWRTDVAEYSSVNYTNAWNGVDLVYKRADAGGIEYTLDASPGANLSAVGLQVQGATATVENGELVLTTAAGTKLTESAPLLSQTAADGTQQNVSGQYTIRKDGSIGFTIGNYDTKRALVVDPTLNYTATFGSHAYNSANGVTADSAGNAYVVGSTGSAPGGSDTNAFIRKYNTSGSLVWSDEFGGTASYDQANAIAIDPLFDADYQTWRRTRRHTGRGWSRA
jgi:hypothetical protein